MTGLYICYWSFQDPLCQSQSLAYLRELTKRGHTFALMTFEQEPYRTTDSQRKDIRRQLQDEGIHWYPLGYHKRLPLLATAYDCLRGVLTGMRVALWHRPEVVHSRSSIPAAMALPIAALCRLKFLYDADARLSEEYADNGHWSREGRAFRLTAWVEKMARRRADALIVLSEKLRDDFVHQFGVSAPVEVIPCCVDTEALRFDAAKRLSRRSELQLTDEKLFVYVGKTGPRYQVDEMFRFFRFAKERLKTAHLLVLSGEDPAAFQAAAERQGVSRDNYCVRRASREKVGEYLAAADAGLAFIRSAGCERGSSPIKVGEYLAAGLPVVLTAGIGDYSDWVTRHRLGFIIAEFDDQNFAAALTQLTDLWAEAGAFRDRAHEFAEQRISLQGVGADRYEKVYHELVGTDS